MAEIKRGTRLRLIEMPNDPDAIAAGATCVVVAHVGIGTSLEQLWVDWEPPDEHRMLNLLPGVDRYEVIDS